MRSWSKVIHDLGEYDEVWDIKELETLLPKGWKLWRIRRTDKQDTWRASKPGHRNVEARHFQTVVCKTRMIAKGFLDEKGQIIE